MDLGNCGAARPETRLKPAERPFLCSPDRVYSAGRLGGVTRVTDIILAFGGLALIRSELIQKIADENPHLYQRDVDRIVSTILDEITGAMSSGNRVELRGFGAFSVKQRDPRVGRNPRTGDAVTVEQKHVPFFKTGKLLRDRLNGK